MSAPIIRSISQTVVVDGFGRDDLAIGAAVTCTDINPENIGQSYVWSFVDQPIGSTAGITDATVQTCSFVPDVTGSYFIKCTVGGAAYSQEIFAVLLPNTSSRIPAFTETIDYTGESNLKGWHTALTAFMRDMDEQISTLNAVLADGSDPLPGTLSQKLYEGTNISLSVVAIAGVKRIQISNTGRIQKGIDTGSVTNNILTVPSTVNFCRVSITGTLNGIDPTGFSDNSDVIFFVTNASPSAPVRIVNGATVLAPALPFSLPPPDGSTVGEDYYLDTPSTVTCWLDLTSNVWRLRCLPVG